MLDASDCDTINRFLPFLEAMLVIVCGSNTKVDFTSLLTNCDELLKCCREGSGT